MAQVDTTRGPVNTSELGTTLMHEHVFVLDHEMTHNRPQEWDEGARIALAVERLTKLKACGVDTILDLTVVGLGRSVELVRKVTDQVDINVIVSTGLYEYHDVPPYFKSRDPLFFGGGTDPMTAWFVEEITEGIADTGIRASVIKCCTDEPGVTPGIERILRCCAQAHRETGAPISTHTHAESRRGLEQQEIFASEGVDLSRVVIGHSGDSEDIDYLEELMKAGSFIGMDRFGMEAIASFEQRCRTVATLVERGWAGQMVLSHDVSCYTNWIPEDLLTFLPNWRLTHISEDVLPELRRQGVSDDAINTMLVENPCQIFENTTAY